MKLLQRALCLTIGLLLVAFTVQAQDSLNITLQGRWAFGPMYSATTANISATDYLLMGDGGFLELWDISTPATPAQIGGGNNGRLPLPEQLEAITVLGDYAYIADDESGLLIVDVSTPDSPALVGMYNTDGRALDVDVTVWGDLNSVHYVDANTGWVVGYWGKIIKTTDGGSSWDHQTSGTVETLNSGYFLTAYNGWVAGDNGTLLKTTNGGSNWSTLTSGVTDDLRDIHFPNTNTGWAVGAGAPATILMSTDGGGTWSAQTSGTANQLNSVHFYNSMTGWAVGASGTILNTTDGGNNWSAQTSGTANDLHSVHFYDNQDGWAVGASGTIVYTADGGTNWSTQTSGTANDLHSVHFYDNQDGWAVGAGGTIIDTPDGGTNWSAQTSGVTEDLHGVHFVGTSDGWAVGANGQFLDTSDGGSNWSAETGMFAYVADGMSGLRVIDVTDPTSPFEVGYFETGGTACGVIAFNDFVYVLYRDYAVTTENGVRVYDAYNPATIFMADSYMSTVNNAVIVRPLDFAIANIAAADYVFIADSTGLRSIEIDLTTPSNPILASDRFNDMDFEAASGTACGIDIDVTNTNAYVSLRNTNPGIERFDISSPLAIGTPALTDQDVLTVDAWGVILDPNAPPTHAYLLVGTDGFRGYDIGIALDGGTQPVYSFTGYGLLRDVVVLGNYAYIADADDGLRKIDISTPSAPVQDDYNIAHYVNCTANGLAVSGDYLYVAAGLQGLKIYDVDDINSMIGNWSQPTGGEAYGVTVSGTYAYVADGYLGLRIIDVSVPNLPSETGYYDFTDPSHLARDVVVYGDYAYVAVGYSGLSVINISNKAAPSQVGFVSMAGEVYAVDIDVLGQYVYVADGVDGLRVVDVRTPTFPNIVGTLNTDGTARDIRISNNYAYIADGSYGLRLINIFTPTAPQEVGYYNTGDDAYGVFNLDSDVYIADNQAGLYIFDNTLAHATHFTAGNGYDIVAPTGRSIPVVIQFAQILGSDAIAAGDEIAIFDADTVVGIGVYEGRFPFSITVWMEYTHLGTTLRGAKQGNNMIFRLWNQSTNDVLPCFAVYSTGNGTFDEAYLLTVVETLTAYQLDYFDPVDPTGLFQDIIILNDISINKVPIVSGDEIGVYDGTLCVGAAAYQGTSLTIPVWLSSAGMPGATLDNYMSFKIYRISDGTDFDARATYAEGSTGQFGQETTTVTKLEAFTSSQQFIQVRPGRLNLISFNTMPLDSANQEINAMLDQVDSLIVCQNDLGQYYLPGQGIDEIGQADLTDGYQLYQSGVLSDTAIITGYTMMPEDYGQSFTSTQFYMVGYPYQNAHHVTDVFASISPYVVVVQDDDGLAWVPLYGLNDIDNAGGMMPGKGYKIYVDNLIVSPLLYTYPVLFGGRPKPAQLAKESRKTPEKPKHFIFKESGLAYTVVLTGSEKPLDKGDEIGLYAGDLCVGARVFQGEFPISVPAWEAVDQNNLKVPGFEKGQDIAIRVWRETSDTEYSVPFTTIDDSKAQYGSGAMAVLELGNFEESQAIPTTYKLDQNYPNPFNPETTIQYQLPETNHVTLTIFNSIGQKIRTLVNEEKNAGFYTVKWDGFDDGGIRVASGIYFISLKAGNYQELHKMMLIQ